MFRLALRAPALLLSLCALPALALPSAPSIDTRLRAVLHHQLAPQRLLPRAGRADSRLPVYVDVPGGATTLRQRGWQAYAASSDIARLVVDEAALAQLVKEVDLRRIELAPRLRKSLDRSGPAINAPQARLDTGLDGTGVLVAQIDTGADLRHRDFRNADGTTRFALYVDMTTPADGRHPSLDRFGGSVYLRDEIDAVLAAETIGQTPPLLLTGPDTQGHGTHVLSIAAGNGLATGNGYPAGRYVGIAPGADLAAVQALDADGFFDDQAILDGARAVLTFAGQRGQPAVVNMSLGGPGGPRDGSNLFDRVLDEIFPPGNQGRALVVAVGNEGALDQHAAIWQPRGRNEITFEVGSTEDPDAVLAIEFFYRQLHAEDTLEVTLIDPLGREYGPATLGNEIDNGDQSKPRVVLNNGQGDPEGSELTNGLALVIANGTRTITAGIWRLRFTGTAERLDCWAVIDPDYYGSTHFLDHVSRDTLVGTPATAKHAIVVGAYATRADYLSLDGPQFDTDVVLGETTYFSSSGPTTDGRFVPDVTAPGQIVIAAMSGASNYLDFTSDFFSGDPDRPGTSVAEDGVHGALSGTSMASPHVAGVVALLFELDPTLDGDRVRAILRSTARPAPRENGYSPRGGFGQIQTLAALHYAGGQRGQTVSPARSSVGVNRDVVPPSDERFVVTVTPRDDRGLPLGDDHEVQIASSAGLALDPPQAVGGGRWERTFLSKGPHGATAIVSATVDGVQLPQQPKVFFVADRSEAGPAAGPEGGPPFVPSGGCSVEAEPVGVYYTAPMAVLRLFLCFLFALALSGCGKKIGIKCTQNIDCDPLGTRFCDVSSPGGYCTIEGCEEDTCPDEAVCVRFYTQDRSQACTFLPELPNSQSDCGPDERCVCDESAGSDCVALAHCAPESSERRWCMKKCGNNGDCRNNYECRSTGTLGALPVPTLDNPDGTAAKFCAPASVFQD